MCDQKQSFYIVAYLYVREVMAHYSEQSVWLHEQANPNNCLFQFQGYPCNFSPSPDDEEEEEENRAASASRSHSQAEKRRRDRINTQLSTLRKFIPNSDKMDKAALLGCVVEHVKELKRNASEISKVCTVPTDVDEVTILDFDIANCDYEENSNDQNKFYIQASLCCDDRPELSSELNQALAGLSLRTVRADLTILGGRIKGSFVFCSNKNLCEKEMKKLKDSLKLVLNRIATSTSSSYVIKSKRQRFFFPSM